MPTGTRGSKHKNCNSSGASSQATVENCSSVSASQQGVTQGSTSQPSTMADVDPKILDAIRKCVREETAELKADIKLLKGKLDSIDKLSQSITTLTTTITAVENGLQFASQRLDHMGEKIIPAVNRHMSSLSQRLLHETLKMDAHRRKWNIVLHGINGPAAEDETATRKAVKDFAQSALKLSPDDINDSIFSACHRLSQKENAGIIIRFVDLTYRDKWLAGAKNIQTYISELRPPNPDKKISMAIDLPPNLRPLKDNLMKKRKELPLEKRRRSKLRYLANWPFVELRVEGESPIRPSETLADIAKSTLGLDLSAQIPLFENG